MFARTTSTTIAAANSTGRELEFLPARGTTLGSAVAFTLSAAFPVAVRFHAVAANDVPAIITAIVAFVVAAAIPSAELTWVPPEALGAYPCVAPFAIVALTAQGTVAEPTPDDTVRTAAGATTAAFGALRQPKGVTTDL